MIQNGSNIVLNITLAYHYLHVEQRLAEFNMFKIVTALAVLITPSLMFAQDLCDTLGALEADPKAVAPAVSFQDIQPTNLIEACAVAIDRADDGLPRFLLQRGRGYLRAGDSAAAMADIQKSHDMGYSAATFGLATAYYLGDDVEQDFERARALFELAYEEGVRRSAQGLSILYANEAYEHFDLEVANTWAARFEYKVPDGLSAPRHLIDLVLAKHQRQCDRDLAKDIDAFDLNEPTALTTYADDFYDLKISSNGTLATVIHAGFACGDLGHLWSGSGGSPLYVIADGQIFENWLSHRPFSFERDGETFLMIPKHGSGCQTSDPELIVAGADICYAVVLWHDIQRTFYGYGNVLEYSDLNPMSEN
jgi:hypothetical protein